MVNWFKAEGEAVRAGELLLEVQFDKVATEVAAPRDGVLARIRVPAGQPVRPGDVVCEIAERPGAPAEVSAGAGSAAAPAAAGGPTGATGAAPAAPVSPAARRLAKELGVDLSRVQGSGPGGRITEADVRRAAEAAGAPAGPGPAGGPAAPAGTAAAAGQRPVPIAGVQGRWEPLPPAQRVLASRMAQSMREAPQLTLERQADVTALVRRREALREQGSRVTLTDLLHRAVALALREHPRLQAVWQEDALFVPEAINLGVAVADGDLLVVPVIRGADRLSLEELAAERERLVAAARAGTLTARDLEGGTFTVTNLGGYGIDFFTPILNPPQSAILGVGRVADALALEGERVVARKLLTLSLTIDHRVVNGAPAALFLDRLAGLLAEPEAWATVS